MSRPKCSKTAAKIDYLCIQELEHEFKMQDNGISHDRCQRLVGKQGRGPYVRGNVGEMETAEEGKANHETFTIPRIWVAQRIPREHHVVQRSNDKHNYQDDSKEGAASSPLEEISPVQNENVIELRWPCIMLLENRIHDWDHTAHQSVRSPAGTRDFSS